MREYAVRLRTDQQVQVTHLWYIMVLAQSLQLRVKFMNTVFVCHVGLLSDLFEQLHRECKQRRRPYTNVKNGLTLFLCISSNRFSA